VFDEHLDLPALLIRLGLGADVLHYPGEKPLALLLELPDLNMRRKRRAILPLGKDFAAYADNLAHTGR
jgi:hypothetical protein